MDLKVVLVVVFLSALAITSTNARIPSCCIRTERITKRLLLLKVERWERQSSSGVCDIDAVKLYVEGRKKPFCLPSETEKILKMVQHMKRQQTKKT